MQDDEARSIIDRGNAQSSLLLAQGRRARKEGRAALIGNVLGGITSGLTTAAMAEGLDTQPIGAKSILQPSAASTENVFGNLSGSEVFGSDLSEFSGIN